MCPRLVHLMSHSTATVATPALRAVGNIVTGDDTQTQYIVGLEAIPKVRTKTFDQPVCLEEISC